MKKASEFIERFTNLKFMTYSDGIFKYRSKVHFELHAFDIRCSVEIGQISVPKRFRGMGYGKKFLHLIATEADLADIDLELEVFPFDAAKDTFINDQERLLRLYEQYGFARTFKDAANHLGMVRASKFKS